MYTRLHRAASSRLHNFLEGVLGLFNRKKPTTELAPVEPIGAVAGVETTFEPQADYPLSVSFTPGLEQLIVEDSLVEPSGLYRHQPAVRICVDYLAQNMAQLNLKSYKRVDEDQRESAADSRLAKSIQRPNPRETRFEMLYALVADWALYANAFWLKQPGDRLYRIPPQYVTIRGGNLLTGPGWFEVNTNGTPVRFEPEEIVHFCGYTPEDTRYGQSRLHALRQILREEAEASRFRAIFWRKGARMDMVLLRPKEAGNWKQPAFDRFMEGWRKFSRGGALEGETAILEDGMTPKEISFSPKEAEFVKGREWALDIVATAYGIPLAMLSRTNTATYASMREFHKVLYQDVLGPICAMIESTINTQLAPDYGDDLYVEFNIAEKLQGDFEQSADAFRSHVQVPDLSVNESRKRQNLPPIGDPDDPENPFNIPAQPTNYAYGPAPAAPEPKLEVVTDTEGDVAAVTSMEAR